MRAFQLHDYIVSKRLEKMRGQIDVVHLWPLAAVQTMKVAARLGIPTFMERPNAHTRYAQEVVRDECERLGVQLPPDYEHAYNEDVLEIEDEEYSLADYLLCPSEFVVDTHLQRGTPSAKLVRHAYGFDERTFHPAVTPSPSRAGIKMIFAGLCAVRKGLHFALEAWLKSPAHRDGTFLIAGQFLPSYADRLKDMLSHPSVQVLGQRNDVPELMRNSDVLVLPTLEEGSPLVCMEAIASGCVPLVSTVCTDPCRHMENSLIHQVGDVTTLSEHITLLHENRVLLSGLRRGCLQGADRNTWTVAARKLLEAYQDGIGRFRSTIPAMATQD